MMEVVAEAGAQQPWDQFKEEVEIKEEDGGGHDAVGEPLTREIKKRLDHAHGSSNGNGAHHANGGEEKEEGEDNANGGEEEEVKVAPEEKHESIFFDPAKGHNKSTCKLRHGIASAGPSANVNAGPSGSANAGPSGSANPPAYAPCHVPAMGSQQSTAKRGKRKATSDLGAKNVKKRATNAGSQGTRSYTTSGNTINVHPLVQGSQASSSVTVNVSYGTATARSTSNGTGTRKKKYERLLNLLGFEK